MIVIGITGSIGMGKTTAGIMLRGMGYPVHNADEAVHKLLGSNGAAVAAVADAFPQAYVAGNRSIDRARLRAALGHDHEKWDRMERILHPLVRVEQRKFIARARCRGARIVILDIPLLFETGGEKRVDYTICMTAPHFLQRQRVLARTSASAVDFSYRLSRQMPDAEKRKRADFVVQTGIGYGYTRQRLRAVMRELEGKHIHA
jgi:dephospho-CoA kinase